VLLKASPTPSFMRTLLMMALAFASAGVIAAQAPRSLPSLMLSHSPGSGETSIASAHAPMQPKNVAVVTVASSIGEHSATSQMV
jgi:uncharacterized membrane protein AbrB (regulator of aidB expression)